MWKSLLVGARLAAWSAQTDARYHILETARHQSRPDILSELLPAGEKYVPTASSLTILAVLSDESLRAVFAGINAGPLGVWIRDELENRIACDLDQSWVRRQYAPQRYPPLHAPHGWHQDGALRFDFPAHSGQTFPPATLLDMVTCWIALGPCGDEAPGLEFVTRRPDGLLVPAKLTDESVRAQFAPEALWCPVMDSGDALLFRGDILHRTHVAPTMTKDRTSIELRFFPADDIPARLNGDRFVLLD